MSSASIAGVLTKSSLSIFFGILVTPLAIGCASPVSPVPGTAPRTHKMETGTCHVPGTDLRGGTSPTQQGLEGVSLEGSTW